MAIKKSTSKPVSVKFTTPDPDNPKSFHAEVGGQATWTSNTPRYPKFEIRFKGNNPSNNTKNAKFSGANEQSVVLPLISEGQFYYSIRHIQTDGNHKVTGPFSLGVAPGGQFSVRCGACPPFGNSSLVQ